MSHIPRTPSFNNLSAPLSNPGLTESDNTAASNTAPVVTAPPLRKKKSFWSNKLTAEFRKDSRENLKDSGTTTPGAEEDIKPLRKTGSMDKLKEMFKRSNSEPSPSDSNTPTTRGKVKTLHQVGSMDRLREMFRSGSSKTDMSSNVQIASLYDPIGRSSVTKVPDHVQVDELNNLKIYSFGNPPTQSIHQHTTASYEHPEYLEAALSDNKVMDDGTKMVAIAQSRYSTGKESLFSHSFTACTPLAASYKDGTVGLYHAFSAALDDENRAELLDKQPSDVFVVLREGTGAFALRQRAHAAYVIDNAPPGCNIHVVEVKSAELAVEIGPEKLTVIRHPQFGF